MTIAYIYKWTHIPTSKWYIGVRTKKGCHPNDGYICSSKIVKPMIQENPEEWKREILYTGKPQEMIQIESKILSKFDAKNDPNSYNLQNGDGNFTTTKIEMPLWWRQKISQGNKGKKRSLESIENYKIANRKKAQDPEYIKKLKKPKPERTKEKISKALSGKPKSKEHRKSMSKSRKGKKRGPMSEKRKKSISDSLKGKSTLPLIKCPHCGLQGRSNMKRWHFDNCRNKTI
jgi:hypothetical protein